MCLCMGAACPLLLCALSVVSIIRKTENYYNYYALLFTLMFALLLFSVTIWHIIITVSVNSRKQY